MERVFETQRRLDQARPPGAATRVTSLPIAGDGVFGAIARFYDRLDGVRDLLIDGDVTSARLVVNPERMVVAEARRTFTYLSLFGYHVDAVIANRMLPDEIADPWFARWKATQSAHLDLDRGRVRGRCRCSRPSSPSTSSSGLDELATSARRCTAIADPAARLSRSSNRCGSMPSARRWCCRCTCRSPSATT